MNLIEKVNAVLKAEKEYTDLDGTTYAEMKANNWDSLLDTANNNIYNNVFGMSVSEALETDWHNQFLDMYCDEKNAAKS